MTLVLTETWRDHIQATFWNFRDGIPTGDQFGCARHEVLYATAGSNLCQVADPQHVEAISGNARQVSKHHLYKFCGAHLQNKPPMNHSIKKFQTAIETILSQRISLLA